MLTNFRTVKQSIARLKELDAMEADGSYERRPKHEVLQLNREREKLERSLGGFKNLNSLPDALFVIDIGHEDIAVQEAKKLGIPVVAVVDTNYDPRLVDYPVPGNDDAIRAVQLYTAAAADAVLEGKSAAPMVAENKDEFVELDAEGNPIAKDDNARRKPQGRKPPPRGNKPQQARRPPPRGPRPPAERPSAEATPAKSDSPAPAKSEAAATPAESDSAPAKSDSAE
jgi:small subunit ribosomal protein S2